MVNSPCDGVCKLDEDGICVSCCRTKEDIMKWSQMTEKERKNRIKELNENCNNCK